VKIWQKHQIKRKERNKRKTMKKKN